MNGFSQSVHIFIPKCTYALNHGCALICAIVARFLGVIVRIDRRNANSSESMCYFSLTEGGTAYLKRLGRFEPMVRTEISRHVHKTQTQDCSLLAHPMVYLERSIISRGTTR